MPRCCTVSHQLCLMVYFYLEPIKAIQPHTCEVLFGLFCCDFFLLLFQFLFSQCSPKRYGNNRDDKGALFLDLIRVHFNSYRVSQVKISLSWAKNIFMVRLHTCTANSIALLPWKLIVLQSPNKNFTTQFKFCKWYNNISGWWAWVA